MTGKKDVIRIRFWVWPLIFIFVLTIVILSATPNSSYFGMFLTFMWGFLYLPALTFEILGFLKGDVQLAGSEPTSKKMIIQITTIAKNNTLSALNRTIESILQEAPKLLNNWRIDLVTEELAESLKELRQKWGKENKINFIIVPRDYQTKNKTRYKARAHQYALEFRKTKDKNTYIYHLDEDSSVTKSAIASIAEAAERGALLGQGVLTFPNHLSPNFFTTLCDSIRTGNDLGCFRFFTGSLKTPLIGMHGEHLLIREDIENEIGWDCGDNLVEDSTFAIEFARRYPGKSCFLNSIVRCASPASIQDLIKQRARWFKGMRQIIWAIPWKSKILISLRLAPWGLGIFGNVIFVYAIAFLFFSLSYSSFYPGVISRPFIFLTTICYSFVLYMYLTGLLVNLREEKSAKKKLFYMLSLPLLLPFLGLIEALGALYSFKIKGFVVVKKPR